MKEFWNKRYGADEYAYGTFPNQFLKNQLQSLNPGKILFPAEGEGRNAVFAAINGWQVSAFDMSSAGKTKALKLAEGKNVSINYQIESLQNFSYEEEAYDAVSLIYVHIDPDTRALIHEQVIKSLKPGGKIILEAFSKKQLGKPSGGPKNLDWLFSKDDLAQDFKALSIDILEETSTLLDEGSFHKGEAEVVRLVATKL